MIHNANTRQSFHSSRSWFRFAPRSRSHRSKTPSNAAGRRDSRRAPYERKTRRKSGSFVPPERRRRATRRETRGFEWIKIHSITARHRVAVDRRRASIPSRVPSASAFPRKDEARSASSHACQSHRRSPYLSCCQTPTQEYVVPKSMPTAGPSALLMFVFVCVVTKNVRRNLSHPQLGGRAATLPRNFETRDSTNRKP